MALQITFKSGPGMQPPFKFDTEIGLCSWYYLFNLQILIFLGHYYAFQLLHQFIF